MLDFAGCWWTLVDLSWLEILPAVILPVWSSLIFVEEYNSTVQKTGTSFHPLVYKLISILLTGLVSVGITVPFLHRFDSNSMQHGGNHMQFTWVIHTDAIWCPWFFEEFWSHFGAFSIPKTGPGHGPGNRLGRASPLALLCAREARDGSGAPSPGGGGTWQRKLLARCWANTNVTMTTMIATINIMTIPGSPWSWKFPHQSQNRSILPNSREKELLNGYFHSRTLFLTPERFRTVLNAFWALFSTPERPKCQERQKPLWCSFFHTNPQNRSFLGLELKNRVFGRSSSRILCYFFLCKCVSFVWSCVCVRLDVIHYSIIYGTIINSVPYCCVIFDIWDLGISRAW